MRTIEQRPGDFSALVQAVVGRKAPFKFQAKGFSMSPCIRDGDMVTVAPVSPAALHFGAIVACREPRTGTLLVHRFIGKKDGRFLIKGDNKNTPDGLFAEEDIIGCVTSVERNGRDRCFSLGNARIIIALLSAVSVLAPALYCLRRLVKPFRKQSAK